MTRPAVLTFDMDDLDVLAEGYGLRESHPLRVYSHGIPRVLAFLDEMDAKATFFVIADRLRDPEVRAAVREMAACGHEIANHSLHHRHLIHLSHAESLEDTRHSTALLEETTGQKVIGYRGPSLTTNPHMPAILTELGYRYDSTINPTHLFIFEWIYLSLHHASRRNRPELFYFRHMFAPSAPYFCAGDSLFRRDPQGALLEIPVSTVPWLRVPFYPTFHFLFPFSFSWFKSLYLRNTPPVLIAHVLDFLDLQTDNLPQGFAKHPGLDRSWSEKRRYFMRFFHLLQHRHGGIRSAGTLAQHLHHTRNSANA
ncbi:MAG: polysaccharide deacetylase family protein [Magnetococcales bacterium]|nr:polysaccharide deacetylase family protein [Magnetococcales bacterium]